MDLPFVEYDRSKIDFARQLRKSQTKAEWIFWHMILKHRPLWYKFTRQKPISGFIADFYCSKLLLIIEIDGENHNDKWEYDNERDLVISKFWIEVIRYTNDDILKNLDWVNQDLLIRLKERENYL